MKTLFLAASILALASPAAAWAPPAHQLIGAIADRLLTPNASQHVHDLLGVDLKTAATWGDCARFVQRQPNGAHVYAPPEGANQTGCAAFTTPAGLARMTDYAARNWDNCVFVPGRPCSASYHVTDVAFLHDEYDRAYFGANFRDSVAATSAAIRVLQGFSAPAPFSIKDQAEALFMITHFAGALHEALAVASVYLDPQGRVVDPDSKQISNPLATSTHASSLIRDGGETLKAEWEAIPADLASLAPEAMLAYARGVPPGIRPVGCLAQGVGQRNGDGLAQGLCRSDLRATGRRLLVRDHAAAVRRQPGRRAARRGDKGRRASGSVAEPALAVGRKGFYSLQQREPLMDSLCRLPSAGSCRATNACTSGRRCIPAGQDRAWSLRDLPIRAKNPKRHPSVRILGETV